MGWDMQACSDYCGRLAGCTGFWFYERGSYKGRCCPKQSWTPNSWRAAANGGFYERRCELASARALSTAGVVDLGKSGCNNHGAMLMQTINGQSVIQCAAACRAKAGCVQIVIGSAESSVRGTCFLYRGACQQDGNLNWNAFGLGNFKNDWTYMGRGRCTAGNAFYDKAGARSTNQRLTAP